MAAATGIKSSLLHLFSPWLARRPAAAAAAAFSSAATVAGRGTARTMLGSSFGSSSSSRLKLAAQRLGALHSAAVICSAASDGVLEVQLKVDGMVCEGCSSRVEETLAKMAGVKKVVVDLEKGLAMVQVEAGAQADPLSAAQPLAEAVRGLGFDAEPHVGQAA